MEVKVTKDVCVSPDDLVSSMTAEELASLLDLIANKFDDNFKDRRMLAEAFGAGISETGARFLAEVIASTVGR